jgi:soluble lytic murein transglycosylase-like protein
MSLRRAPFIAGLLIVLGVCGPIAARAGTRPVPANTMTIDAYATVLREYNPHLPGWQSKELARHLLVSAQRFRLDTNMLAAIVSVESSWNTGAVSYAGAVGLGQLMPGTAAKLGVDPYDPAQNLSGAAKYLCALLQRFASNPHRYELTFAAYNAGPKAVQEFGGVPPYGETQRYVLKVLRAWHHLQHIVRLPGNAFIAQRLATADERYWLGDSPSR